MYLQNCFVILRGEKVPVPPFSGLQLPEIPLLLLLAVGALATLVVPVKVVFSIVDGELLARLDVLDGLETDCLALTHKVTVGKTAVVGQGDGAEDDLDTA